MTTPLRLRFTVPQFNAYVKTLPKPTWGVRCVSLHHTYIPDQHTWHGQNSVDGIVRYWQTLGWTHYVHLFVALEAGVGYVYVCNPLTERGTGVKGRNSDSIHIEHPWNGDLAPFDPRLVAASREVQAAVGDWAGIPVQRTDPNPATPARGLFYHRWRRDAYKSCPGSKVTDTALIGRPQPVEEDDVKEEERIRWNTGRVSDVKQSYDIAILGEKVDAIMEKLGLPQPVDVIRLKAAQAHDVAQEKANLGLS